MTYVEKNGKLVVFDKNLLVRSIKKANDIVSSNRLDDAQIEDIASSIQSTLETELAFVEKELRANPEASYPCTTTEDIRNMAYMDIMEAGCDAVAREYAPEKDAAAGCVSFTLPLSEEEERILERKEKEL